MNAIQRFIEKKALYKNIEFAEKNLSNTEKFVHSKKIFFQKIIHYSINEIWRITYLIKPFILIKS